ncbi:DNA polymerase [Delftia acidovorans]|uniref:TIGR03915 family putative DNA repair protein n=1 Tax=Delftia acidovorans TaxID=80866 RepID=UPI000F4B807B|nr:TIGR03915 family putative DNA repair protein [Delftia acidovorans]ROR04500.1 DNA polymerase [Delftia acidovorans]
MQAQALTIELDSPDDWPGFRAACRALLAHGADPALVRWRWPDTRGAQPLGAGVDLFSSAPQQAMPASALAGLAGPGEAGLSLSDTQMSALRHACMHRAAGRFELCHRWLARMQARPELRLDALDADWRAIEALARPVSREIHKMHAFVRFRTTQRPDQPDLHIAWFEPEHHIVRAAAPFFCKRFANMHWAILTPQCSAHWDGHALRLAPGARRSDAPPADAGEALWLTYYASTFNPARLKEQAMLREMPRRYWHNLPETVLISTLVQQARARTAQMLAP